MRLRSPSSSRIFNTLIGFIALGGMVNAEIRTRNNTGTTFDAAGGWSGNAVPSTNDIALWNSTSALTNTLGVNRNLLAIQVTDTAGTVVIGGSGVITLGGVVTGNSPYNVIAASIDLSAAQSGNTLGDLQITSGLSLLANAGQIWNVGAGRTFTFGTSTSTPSIFTRNAGATLNVRGSGNVVAYGINNDATGIIGTWATIGTGASTSFTTVNSTTNQLQAYTSTTAALDAMLSATGNFQTAATSGSFGAGTTFNTLRYTGVATSGTIGGNYTANGILNSGTGSLILSGNATIGSSSELVLTAPDSTRTLHLSGSISNNGSNVSRVTVGGEGTTILSGANTYTGQTAVTRGTLEIRHNDALGIGGSASSGTTIYTASKARLSLSGNITTNEYLTFTGADPTNTYFTTLHNASGTNTLTGLITLEGGVRIGSGGAATTLNIQGGVTTSNNSGIVFNLSGGNINFTTNSINLGTNSFYSDQSGLIRLGVAGNTWSSTVVAAGTTLRLDIANALPSASTLQMGVNYNTSASTVDLNGFNQTIARLTQQTPTPGIITSQSGPATLTLNQSSTGYFSGTFTQNIALTKSNTGRMHLGGDNTHTGKTIVSGGALEINRAEASSQSSTLVGTDIVTVASAAGLAIGQSVSGTGIQTGSYITAINYTTNAVTFSRAVTSGTSGAPVVTTLSFGALNGSLRGSTVSATGAGVIEFGHTTTATTFGGLEGANNLVLTNRASNAVALTIGTNNESTNFTGNLSGSGGSIIKEGTGNTRFGGANAYTGTTTVAAGALYINGVHASAGSYTVASGAKLGGSGSITGAAASNITLGAGSFLAIGNSHGSGAGADTTAALFGLSTQGGGNISLAGTMQFDIFSSVAGADGILDENDILKLSGTTTNSILLSGIIELALSQNAITTGWSEGDRWKIIDWGGVAAANVNTTGLTLGTTQLNGYILTGQIINDGTANSGYYIVASAVPEPTRALLLAIVLGAFVWRRKR